MAKNYKHKMDYHDGWKKLTGKIPFSMSNDYLFRALLQADEDTLRALVSTFLNILPDEIDDIEVTNPITLGESVEDKEFHLDVRVVVNYDKEIDFEMQMQRHKGWIERSVVYICRVFDNVNHGDEYTDIKGVWQISFCDFALFPDAPEFFSNYSILNDKKLEQKYTDKFRISNVNLTAIDLATQDDIDSGIVKWAKLFAAKTWEDLIMLTKNDSKMDQAVSSAWQLSEDKKIQEQMRRRAENEWLWKDMEDSVAKAQSQLAEAQSQLEDTQKLLSDKDKQLSDKDKIISKLMAQLNEAQPI